MTQVPIGEIVSAIKTSVLQLINETMDEFEVRELTDEQKTIINDFSGSFGQKVINLNIILEK